jgi:hypothetical protein
MLSELGRTEKLIWTSVYAVAEFLGVAKPYALGYKMPSA